MAAIKALQQWCKIQCDGYRDVSITNMTTSFRDGLAFCALIHKHRPDLINYDSLSKENVYDNNNLAFRVAEEQLGIPALLDAEDMVALKVPDRLSILTYVSQYYNFFHGRSPIGGMGGIKRPAEDPKEEPSVKKNLPVIAKPATENRPPVTVVAPTPSRPLHKPDRVTDQKNVLTEKSNKMGTLSSTCAVCKNHVHLVQRHLVDGKLYHRSCFKCHQCSNILLSGTYQAGQKPGTFVCTTHQGTQNSSKATTSRDFGKNGSGKAEAGSSLPAAKRDRSPNPRPVSVLSTPVNVSPQPNKQSPAGNRWTPSAERTQAARQKFFQATPEPPSSAKLSAVPPKGQDGSRVLLKVDDEKEKARSLISAKLTEGNSNNNNTSNQGGLRTAESRQGKGLATVEVPSWRKDKGSTSKPLEPLARLSTATNKDSPRSSCAFSPSKIDYERSETPSDWRSRLKPVSSGEGLKSANSLFTSEIKVAVKQSPRGSANVLSPQTPMVSITIPFTQPESTRAPSPKQPHRGSGDGGLKNRAASSSVPAPRPETESPPGKSPDFRQEEILKELKQIENSLNDLEKEGVELEKRLRQFEEEGKEELLDALMVDWFTLIRNKQNHMRRESELVYIAKTQELEQQQPGVEGELRGLMTKPEHLKTAADRRREEELMERLVDIVNNRNAIVEGLDEDRLREEEEDQQLNEMLEQLGKKGKNKKKSPLSKLFSRRSMKKTENF